MSRGQAPAPWPLLVAAPLEVEARALRAGLPATAVRATGMGPRRSAAAAARLDGARRALAVAGFCGALDPDLEPGDVVVASEVAGAGGRRACPSAPLLVAALRRLGLRAVAGPVASSERVVRGAERAELHATGAIAVDLETAWLARAAGGGPFAAVRVVLDTPSRELATPATPAGFVRAYRTLRRVGPALAAWAAASGPRRVLLAAPRSFCAGVERAIQIVERALERHGAPVYVRKQIVHNLHVVHDLERRGAVFVDELDQVPPGATVVFSAHGVAPVVRAEAAARRLDVIDATCPLVAKVHTEARRFARDGHTVVLIGHPGHEEVEGTMGEVPDAVRLVSGPADVAELEVPDPGRVAFLTQTTLAVDDVASTVAALRARFPALRGPSSDDICYATQNRQDAVRAAAGAAELTLVVGSANSSNSQRLVEVAERAGCPAHLIDDAAELDPAWLAGTATVALTAGASAPETLVRQVLAALADLGPVEVVEEPVATETVTFTLPKEVTPP